MDGRMIIECDGANYNLEFITGLLNTKLYAYILDLLRTKESFDINPLILRKLPIPHISIDEQKPYIELVGKIIELKKNNNDTTEEENKIDQMIYKLYDLTAEEIEIVDNQT